MVTEEQIRNLAYTIWEQEGRPDGKDGEHYFRAKQILEEQETTRVIELPPAPSTLELAPTPQTIELASPSPNKRRRPARRKKR